MTVLGERLRVYGWSGRGVLPLDSLKKRQVQLVQVCGMTPLFKENGEPDQLAWGYPIEEGKGGYGETIMLPFSEAGESPKVLNWWERRLLKFLMRRVRWAFLLFQPFVESFIAIDTYPEWNKISILLVTCLKPPDNLTRVVVRLFGPIWEGKMGYFEL